MSENVHERIEGTKEDPSTQVFHDNGAISLSGVEALETEYNWRGEVIEAVLEEIKLARKMSVQGEYDKGYQKAFSDIIKAMDSV